MIAGVAIWQFADWGNQSWKYQRALQRAQTLANDKAKDADEAELVGALKLLDDEKKYEAAEKVAVKLRLRQEAELKELQALRQKALTLAASRRESLETVGDISKIFPLPPAGYVLDSPNDMLSAFRKKYPQYDDISDSQLRQQIYEKFYTDIPIDEFYRRIGANFFDQFDEEVRPPRDLFASAGIGRRATAEIPVKPDAPLLPCVALALTLFVAQFGRSIRYVLANE